MNFQAGDQVVHAAYGPGQVKAIEERTFNNATTLYYMVQAADLIVWVPANENSASRLRPLTSKDRFKELFRILSEPVETLPDDRRQRNLQLLKMLENGQVESLFKIIRDLSAYRRAHAWNEYDSAMMKRTIAKLVSEWSASMCMSKREAEAELRSLLNGNKKG